ncbi:MAG: CPBP family intramembrane glutamic endopeptidase [Candidatus Paceibacterota bacterium]|jgi:membrane protease YdiL (CAAX protease family)
MENVHSKQFILYQIFFIFILPVVLLYFKIIPDGFRIFALMFCCLMIYGIIRYEKWTLKDLGLADERVHKEIIPYIIVTIGGLLLILFLAKIFHKSPLQGFGPNMKLILTFIPISFLQEFAFRGFLMPMLKKVFSDTVTIVLLNSVLFTLMHIIYPGAGVVLPLSFIAGIGFSLMYHHYPNLILISISHSVLNFVAVLFGFFYIPHI